MALYGVNLDVNVNRIHQEIRLNISRKQGLSVRNLEKIFTKMDRNKNGKLDLNEFLDGLASLGLFLKKLDAQALLTFYDKDGDKNISFPEFVSALREPLNERKEYIVTKAYNLLDPEQTGYIDVQQIWKHYNVSKIKEYYFGMQTRENIIIQQFLSYFTSLSEDFTQGTISRQEFFDFYIDLSPTIPSDDYFVEYMQNIWGIIEDEEKVAFQANVTDIIKLLRMKLIAKTQGSTDQNLLKKLFRDYDVNRVGFLTIDELQAVLIRLEMPVNRRELAAIMLFLDKNRSGYIEFDEFTSFIINDPFKQL